MAFEELFCPQVKQPLPNLLAPAGFGADHVKSKKVAAVKKPSQNELDSLKVKMAWEVATSPAKSIPMNLIMSYMTGNSMQIIPVTMALMLIWNPLNAIVRETNSSFSSLRNDRNSSEILLPKIVFVLCQLMNMAIGLWKLNQMGLIPNKEADWLSWKPVTHIIERVWLS
ncbi:hypothetical protein FOB63_002357 [Clavispora lusitaniae]|uniref:ER membrane protein complex subunit 4 n=2 Tax=Clavispora lusitaniae TaxID=36911 RepID=C4Y6U7_CLAL4|nr:uncharacterized protein CLUG_03881 [Clavispora lusitaniae ATCC 42720]EEQ39753.1 hypothetical protein CLUG_03881 [Clavispora lusitaniae ATCC 42720]KAF5210611.1 hypothetical protein E0198_003491 [Clavispora lusitaniae]KAF7582276.1 hypothetical protein FOB63_002357 [Clavispora lusitaniae]OVF10826.1 putative ER membrane protein complex subunit [Clavispora lusitaniae]